MAGNELLITGKPCRIRSSGGSGEIRTHGALSYTAVFKTAALNHSATLPLQVKR